MSATTPAELVYEEAVRAIGHQRVRASELRQSASLLIATAAIAVSLLGPADATKTPFGWFAVASFVLVCGMALAVIWPHRDLPATIDVALMVRSLTGRTAVSTETLRHELLTSMAAYQRLNARRHAQVSRVFRTASFVLVAQLIFTVAARIVGS